MIVSMFGRFIKIETQLKKFNLSVENPYSTSIMCEHTVGSTHAGVCTRTSEIRGVFGENPVFPNFSGSSRAEYRPKIFCFPEGP